MSVGISVVSFLHTLRVGVGSTPVIDVSAAGAPGAELADQVVGIFGQRCCIVGGGDAYCVQCESASRLPTALAWMPGRPSAPPRCNSLIRVSASGQLEPGPPSLTITSTASGAIRGVNRAVPRRYRVSGLVVDREDVGEWCLGHRVDE